MYVPSAALVTGMFDKSVRCSAASLSYQLGAILGGGLAPIVVSKRGLCHFAAFGLLDSQASHLLTG